MNDILPRAASSNVYKHATLCVSLALAVVCHSLITSSPFVLVALCALVLLSTYPFRFFLIVTHLVYIYFMAYFNVVDARIFGGMLVVGVLFFALAPTRITMFPALSSYRSRPLAIFLFFLGSVLVVAPAILLDVEVLVGVPWALCLFCFASVVNARPASPAVSLKAALLNCALLFAGLLFSVALLELGCRTLLVDLRQPASSLHLPHPEYLYTLMPGYRGTLYVPLHEPYRKEPMNISISRQGLRGPEHGPKKPDEFRIALVGDSFTFGWGVDNEDTLDRHFEAILRERQPGLQSSVLNVGLGGYGPWQSIGLFMERALPLKPDVVLFQLTLGNDISDTLRKERLFLKSFTREHEFNIFQFHVLDQWQYRVERWLRGGSAAYIYLGRLLRRDSPWIDLISATVLRPGRSTHKIPEVDPEIASLWVHEVDRKVWYDTLEHGWNLMVEDLASFREFCFSRGIDLYFYHIPFPIGPFEHNYERFDEVYEVGRGENRLLAFFEEHQWPYIPVREYLRDLDTDEEPVVFRHDCHFTPHGNRLLAERLYAFLLERDVIPSSDGT